MSPIVKGGEDEEKPAKVMGEKWWVTNGAEGNPREYDVLEARRTKCPQESRILGSKRI